MRTFILACALMAVISDLSYGEDPNKAKASLELELQLMAGKKKATDIHASCLDDMNKAKALAERTKKPIILWVGMKCEDNPVLRASLVDCVHCHMAILNEDSTPRLVVPGTDGDNYRVKKEDATPARVLGIMGRTKPEKPKQTSMLPVSRYPVICST